MGTYVKRLDFMPINPPDDELRSFKKFFSGKMRESRKAAKLDTCLLCGKPQTSYCNSHCLPQFCLREIEKDGHVLTMNEFIELGPMDSTKGVKQAGTFHNICRSCDSTFFADYENPDAYKSDLTQKMMGQIAAKCALLEYGKASEQIELNALLQEAHPYFETLKAVRMIDAEEQLENLKTAKRAAHSGARVYQCIWQHTLGHVVPFAFQGAVSLIAGYRGEMINNTINPSPDYKIVPLYICVFPIAGKTVVTIFVNAKAKRYRHFINDFQLQGESDKLLDLCKIILAHNEDVFFSPLIDLELKNSTSMKRLARMTNHQLFMGGAGSSTERINATLARASAEQFAIPRLPSPPNLFDTRHRIDR